MGNSSSTTITSVNYKQFDRTGKIELWENGRVNSFFNTEGLDFYFQTNEMFQSNPIASVPNNATVKILGLSQYNTNYLCQFMDEASYRQRNISVRIVAGYNNDSKGPQEIMHMLAHRAIPSMPPDNWVTLTLSMTRQAEMLKSYRYIYMKGKENKENTLRTMIDSIGNEFGMEFIWHQGAGMVADKTEVDFFGINGGTQDVIEALRKKYRWLRIVQSKDINRKTGKPYYDLWHVAGTEDDDVNNWKDSSMTVWEIDKEHGMIGLPTYTGGAGDGVPSSSRCIKVRTLLNPSYKAFDYIKLKSQIASGLNGYYHILTVRHTGHLRGNEWYSDITCTDAPIETADSKKTEN